MGKALSIIFTVVQILLTILFLMSGTMKLLQPFEALTAQIPGVPEHLLRGIGLLEILGGVGLLLPSLLRFKAYITIWAAIGLTLLLASAIVYHISIGESQKIGIPAILMLTTLFIIWGRLKKTAIQPKKS